MVNQSIYYIQKTYEPLELKIVAKRNLTIETITRASFRNLLPEMTLKFNRQMWGEGKNLTNLLLNINFIQDKYKFYQDTVVMNKKNAKSKRLHNDAKENVAQNGHHQIQAEPKRKAIKKAEHQLHPLQENHRHKNPQELRHLCQQQEKLILAEYRSNRMFSHEFYEYVKGELADSKICTRIMMIKEMSNEEAQEQLHRIQELRAKFGDATSYFYPEDMKEEDEEEVKVVFKQWGKKVSMIEENDDAYLEELGGGNCYRVEQEADQIMEEEMERHRIEQESQTFSKFSEHQYYQNDDVFEF